ncbi:MAG TPA: glycosyltransferase family 39 protein [Conexibacter sp.]|jgi:4-amino-4-deoxy-L-arabinose transferase-like glycosyltransferase|nr:glycosyltransferase family 39 protein [Conexibacter sp.]
MSATGAAAPVLRAPERAGGRLRERARAVVRRPELLGLLALAAVLNLWALSRNGWANEYYSAAVRSMSTSWHAFLFNAFDPSGVMTLDKPPLALWVQALSARAFGFGSLSMLVPQALMGVASVALTYDLTRRRWGRPAGFAAGLVLALTPIAVAISRHNNPDALLVLCSVAAVWLLVRGLEDGRTRWLVLCGVAIGLGFETKMAVALMVVPGIAAAWLWIAPRGRGRLDALRQLLAGGAALAVVGLAWPVLVWLTPAADRPWVSGTSDNSIWSLIMGYNGLGRLDGQAGGPGGGAGGPGGGGLGGGGGGPFGGSAGPFRLLNAALGGQAGWLLGFALVAGAGGIVATRLRREDARSGWLIAVGGAFATTAVAFSFAQGIFHPYYVSLLAPFAAALVGAGVGLALSGGTVGRVTGALAVAGGVATELAVIHVTPNGLKWLVPLLVLGGGAAVLLLASQRTPRVRRIALAAVLGLLLIAPGAWAVQTLGHATSGTFPAGGPADAMFGGARGPRAGIGGPPGMAGGRMGVPPGMAGGGPGGRMGAPPSGMRLQGGPPGMAGGAQGGPLGGPPGTAGRGGGPFGADSRQLTQALDYAKAHGGGALGVSSQQGASSAVIAGQDVAGIGGFSGRESEVSVAWLADAVRAGKLRWVLADGSGGGMPNDARVGSRSVMSAVAQTCTAASLSSTTSGASASAAGGSSSGTLYDCQGKADALAAWA